VFEDPVTAAVNCAVAPSRVSAGPVTATFTTAFAPVFVVVVLVV
jgi:hypothetical protein